METAECDETIVCTGATVCYELICLRECEVDSDCTETQSCEPCVEDDGIDVTDHCFGRGERVCLENEQ